MQSEFNCYEEGGLSTNNGEQLKMVGKKRKKVGIYSVADRLRKGRGAREGEASPD